MHTLIQWKNLNVNHYPLKKRLINNSGLSVHNGKIENIGVLFLLYIRMNRLYKLILLKFNARFIEIKK